MTRTRPLTLEPCPHAGIDRWISRMRSHGFSPVDALGLAHELDALASPLVFSSRALSGQLWTQAVTALHTQIAGQLAHIQSPLAFSRWRSAWAERGGNPLFARYWMVLAMGEAQSDLELRQGGHWQALTEGWVGHGWDDVVEVLCRRRVMPGLGDGTSKVIPGQMDEVLNHTGLRSVRWGYFENPGDVPNVLGRLGDAQGALAATLGWTGPVLGLGGETGLVLSAGKRTEGAGQVFLDGSAMMGRLGQQLYLDTWDVLAHEWAHTLDSTLARRAGCVKKWATLAILDGMPEMAGTLASTALEAWWTQVLRVQFEPVPEAIHRQLQREVQAWPERILNALGDGEMVCAMVEGEMEKISRNIWTQQDSTHDWKHFFDQWMPEATLARRFRTALLIAGEIALALKPANILPDEPMWAGFLHTLASHQGDSGGGRFTDGVSYLANPVEIMARSFEVAFQDDGHAPSAPLLWGIPQREAGLVYPLEAERAWQREGWLEMAEVMQGWWQGVARDWAQGPHPAT